MRTPVLMTACAIAASLTGCGLHDPYSGAPPRATTSSAPVPNIVNNEIRPSAAPVDQDDAAGAPTPQQALAEFANTYINWTYKTLPANRQRLAMTAVGAARAAQRRAAQETRKDSTLRQARIVNTGRVLSIARLRTRPKTWVVVTQERTTGANAYAGLPAALHVTFAAVREVAPNRYAISSWLPQA